MAFLTEAQVLQRASTTTASLRKSADKVLTEDRAPETGPFDVFLSHSSGDSANLLLGLKGTLEGFGLSVYVDKYSDPQMSPDSVSAKTAETLRYRMKQSSSLLYVHSPHSTRSRWMPWELGYFDALKGKVGVLPVTRAQESAFKGEEYLNLYPYVTIERAQDHNTYLWIRVSSDIYARLDLWIKGEARIERRAA